ncbi:MAG: hypothetical protein HFI68_11830 [Lachnospiraceae bacterium]|nr:hypothetical protein [Lachnospiraceae bacterium]
MKENWEMDPMDQKWIEEAKKTAGLVEPPESLSPEAVVERLKREGRKPEKKTAFYRHFGQVAAALFLFLLLGGGSLWIFRQIGGGENRTKQPGQTKEQMAEGARIAADSAEEEESLQGGYRAASSYEELYAYLKERERTYIYEEYADGAMPKAEAGAEKSSVTEDVEYSAEAVGGGHGEEHSDYSQTNVQVKGVDEADIIKTDGKYLYVVYTGDEYVGQVHIIEVDGGFMREVSKTEPVTEGVYRDYDSVLELYVDGDTMTVLMDCIDEDTAEGYTVTAVYDISDRAAPKLTGALSQDGSYRSSRKNGRYVYVFSNKGASAQEGEKRGYVPYADGKPVPCGDIYYSPDADTEQMVVITAVDTENPGGFTDTKTLYCGWDTMYVSGEAIYAAATVYEGDKSQTELFKVSYGSGKLEAEGSRRFLGWLNNQFSMDEYNGYLRLVATVDDYRSGGQVNSLYVMDEDLEIVGSIHNLAPNERIYSARFMGDTGYFVTFRETDPLFSVDLSDPQNPKIMGELKITGFSSYLHGYSENLLLGIGKEINPRTGETEGLKLSMFDISDPGNVTEKEKKVLEAYQESDALSNHKAVLIDTDKNLFGFLAYRYYWGGDKEEACDYVLYSYEEEWGFTERAVIHFDWSEISGGFGSGVRGVYIGETLYLTGFQDGVRSYSLKSGEELGRIELE